MIEMQYNFPLLAEQGEQWQQRLRAAVEQLHPESADELRPTFRMKRMDHARGGGEVAGERAGDDVDRLRRAPWDAGVDAGCGLGGEDGRVRRDQLHGRAGAGADAWLSSVASVEYDGEGMRADALRAYVSARPRRGSRLLRCIRCRRCTIR
jgi:hypothetical protein